MKAWDAGEGGGGARVLEKWRCWRLSLESEGGEVVKWFLEMKNKWVGNEEEEEERRGGHSSAQRSYVFKSPNKLLAPLKNELPLRHRRFHLRAAPEEDQG